MPSNALLEQLCSLVGPSYVSWESATLRRYARSTLPTGTTPLAVVKPETKEQIQAILQFAAQAKTLVYPISTGKNWGYGDACAPIGGALIVDLSRMNRILDVNTDLAYAVIEPGVTQGQLASYLKEKGIPLVTDCTGAGPDTSIIGNTLARGFGHSPYGDRFAHACNFEAVLSDGSMVTTGHGSYPGAKAQHVYKWGTGPSLDGMLAQFRTAIVTRMTLWLMPKPDVFRCFFITLKSSQAIGPLVAAFRKLRLAGTLRSTIHCFNQHRLLSSVTQFPWDQSDGTRALDESHPEIFAELCKCYGIPIWAASGSLSGTQAEVAAAERSLKKTLKQVAGISGLLVLSERRLAAIERVTRGLEGFSFGKPLARQMRNIRLGFNLLAGTPSIDLLKGGQWRARQPPSATMDPLDSQSGLLWISPVFEATEGAVNELNELSKPIFKFFGFEYQVTLSLINERTVCAVISISYDRGSEKETQRASACGEKLLNECLNKGFIPYRSSRALQTALESRAPSFWRAVERLRSAWDPDGVII